MRVRAASAAVAAMVLTCVLGACSHSTARPGSPGTTAAVPHRDVLVTIGSNATFGDGLTTPLYDAWPQVLYHNAFAQSAVLINASDRDVDISDALTGEVRLAIEQHATVVAVWLGDIELEVGVPVAAFESEMDQLVGRLRGAGARVLIGNLPAGDIGPVAAYNDAIAQVARAHGAIVVDLAAALSSSPSVGPSSRLGLAENRAIAGAFAAAVVPS